MKLTKAHFSIPSKKFQFEKKKIRNSFFKKNIQIYDPFSSDNQFFNSKSPVGITNIFGCFC